MSVSLPFLIASLHAGAWQIAVTHTPPEQSDAFTQTLPVPHALPAEATAPLSVQTAAPEVQRYRLAHHKFVLNGGIYATYREQYLDVANGTTPWTYDSSSAGSGSSSNTDGLIRRDFS